MNKNGLSALFLFLSLSKRDASSAFIPNSRSLKDNSDFNDKIIQSPSVESQSKKLLSAKIPKKSPHCASELMKFSYYIQEALEEFSHGFIIDSLENNPQTEQKSDNQITFLKLINTDSKIHYGATRTEDTKIPASITGKFHTLKNIAENHNFSPTYLYSTGVKSLDSIKIKSQRYPDKNIHDAARLTVFTNAPETLYKLCNHICDYHKADEKSSIFKIDDTSPVLLRGWNQNDNGFFSAKINVPLKTPDGQAYCEIMLRPKQKNLQIDALSHTAYEVARKNNIGSYSNEVLRKWNIVIKETKDNKLADLEGILGSEVRPRNDISPVTAHDFDIDKMKAMFSGASANHESPIAHRQLEMSRVQKELNKKAMSDIYVNKDWSPELIDKLSNKYQFADKMVKIEQVSKWDAKQVQYSAVNFEQTPRKNKKGSHKLSGSLFFVF
jgi:hypothetical protein